MAALVVMMVLATLVLEPRWLNEAGASERFLAAASPTTTRKVVTDSWVKQRLDHFNPADTRAWNQRYFRNDEYYRDGGPLFIFVGGEEPMKTSWLEDSHMMSLAKTYGAAAFFLEHRFYGSSRPTEDVSTQSLAYLTAEQALADLADFVVGVRGKSGAKVVLFGRSYAGSLAAWSRLKYPHLVDGAVASSAPVLAKANFYEFFYGITIELQEESPECIANIRAATTEMKLLLTAEGGPQKLTQLFSLCSPLDTSKRHDVAKLFSSMAALVATAVTDNAALSDGRDSIASACNLLSNSSYGATPLQRYANVMERQLRVTSSRCLLVDEETVVERYRNSSWASKQVTSGDRQWLYQTCTQFGFYQTSESAIQPFGDGMFPLENSLHLCSAVYGDRFTKDLLEEGVARTNIQYGARTPEISNVVFVYGSRDPWSYLGARESPSMSMDTILIEGTSHAADMNAASSSDSLELVESRLAIEEIVGDWLAMNSPEYDYEPSLETAMIIIEQEYNNVSQIS